MKGIIIGILLVTGYITYLHVQSNIDFIEWYFGSSARCCGACAQGKIGEVGYHYDIKDMLVRPYTVCSDGVARFFYQDFTDSF